MVVVAGLVSGFLLSVPPTGPVALLIVRHHLREAHGRAVRMGFGTAAADVPYAALAAWGYDALVRGRPTVELALDASGAALLLGVAAILLRTEVGAEAAEEPPRRFGGDAATGFVLGLLNPTRLLTWGLAASLAAGGGAVPPLVWGLAVGAGGAAWSWTLGVLWRRFGPKAIGWRRLLMRGSALVAAGLALVLAIRVARSWP